MIRVVWKLIACLVGLLFAVVFCIWLGIHFVQRNPQHIATSILTDRYHGNQAILRALQSPEEVLSELFLQSDGFAHLDYTQAPRIAFLLRRLRTPSRLALASWLWDKENTTGDTHIVRGKHDIVMSDQELTLLPRFVGAYVLASEGRLDLSGVPELIAYVSGGNDVTSVNITTGLALLALGHAGDERALEALQLASENVSDDETPLVAIDALGLLGDRRAVPLLRGMLSRWEPYLREDKDDRVLDEGIRIFRVLFLLEDYGAMEIFLERLEGVTDTPPGALAGTLECLNRLTGESTRMDLAQWREWVRVNRDTFSLSKPELEALRCEVASAGDSWLLHFYAATGFWPELIPEHFSSLVDWRNVCQFSSTHSNSPAYSRTSGE